MQNDVVAVSIRGVMPTTNGCAVFLGTEEKTFVIYVDPFVGNAISMAANGEKKERPLTHDLIINIFEGLEVNLQRIIINEVRKNTFYARIILQMQNELGNKLLEIDARPSDSLALAIQTRKPIYATRQVIETVEDMTEILEKLLKDQN